MTAAAVMEDEVILESRPSEGVALLRLNRPEVLNALNLTLRRALAASFTRLDADDEVKAIVLAGNERAFCAGADLNEYVDATPVDLLARGMDRLWGAIATCRKPVIAAVRGHALGGGCELAMHADIIIAGPRASFGQPEVRIGIMPGGGATQRLTRSIGKFHAMKMLLTGRPIDAFEARELGLVSELAEDAQVEERAVRMAADMATLPPLSLRFIKEAVLEGMESGLDAALRLERKSFQILFATQDKEEGIRARLQKRAPSFQGR